jgi:hypothetical protein
VDFLGLLILGLEDVYCKLGFSIENLFFFVYHSAHVGREIG